MRSRRLSPRPHGARAHGFTLAEVLVALSISVTFLGSVVGAWYMSTRSFKEESVRSHLRYDLGKAMERMKADIRLTDGNNILFYPANSSTYTAISLPKATPNANGFYTLSSSNISWDKTVVYHVYTNGSVQELRRTVYNTYSSTTATRQSQLNSLVAAGSDAQGTTTVLAKADAITLEITPTSPTFDGYSASTSLSENTSFGSKQLSSGNHLIRFTVQGKNSASSGYRMGFDQLAFTPSGSGHEAEALTVSASSGASAVNEDMSANTSDIWHGNYQKEYQSAAVSNYVEFQIYYDEWMESNFESTTHQDTEVYGTEPAVRVSSRENQSLSSVWSADQQTGGSEENKVDVYDTTIRNVISASSISGGGQMVRFKFKASTEGPLTISSAYFGARSAVTLTDFSGTPSQLYFGNSTVAPGDLDGTGATGATGSTSITIPAGHYVWSNWLTLTVSSPSATDYLLSMVIPNDPSSSEETYWQASGGGTHAYLLTGSSPTASWASLTPTSDDALHAVSDMAVWSNSGTVTSQVYDTKLSSPSFGALSWSTNSSGSYVFRVRSSANEDMSGATDWSLVSTYSSSPATLTTASNRYVQWQCTMTAASPYSTYPEIDDVIIQWPGQTGLVDVSGYFTKRSDYGIFSVSVDGESLVNALEVQMTASKDYLGRTHSVQLSEEVKARNTGK